MKLKYVNAYGMYFFPACSNLRKKNIRISSHLFSTNKQNGSNKVDKCCKYQVDRDVKLVSVISSLLLACLTVIVLLYLQR